MLQIKRILLISLIFTILGCSKDDDLFCECVKTVRIYNEDLTERIEVRETNEVLPCSKDGFYEFKNRTEILVECPFDPLNR